MNQELRERAFGSLLGLAVGDALGAAVEFMPPGSFPPVVTMTGGGKFSLLPGQWTDDTSMALCMAESFIECKCFDPVDQAKRYLRWYQEGHLSSNGECFDIGMTTRRALNVFANDPTNPYRGSTADGAAGNGSLMRLCPVSVLFHHHPVCAMELSRESSRITHGTRSALDACRYYCGLIIGCFNGRPKEELLEPCFSPIPGYWEQNPMCVEVHKVANGSFKHLNPPDITASGYVVRSLEAALWAFYHTDGFELGCLRGVNLGDDADTVGAIYGQLAGAYYGASSIPAEWKEKCFFSSLIELFADELISLSNMIVNPTIPKKLEELAGPVPTDKLSQNYQNVKLMGYNLLEAKNKEILRKVSPCPRQYKQMEEFTSDVEEARSQYRLLPPAAQSEAILGDFERIWSSYRERLYLRLNRYHI